MADFTCPYCYQEHNLKDCSMKCSFHAGMNTNCPDGVPKSADGWIPNKYYSKCMKCTKAAKDVYCPTSLNQGMELIIPQRCILTKSLPIALVGAKATGKSNYICVLVNEIRRKMSMGFGTSINMMCDTATKTNYEDLYFRPLYREKMQISATDSGEIPPMIFPVDFPNKKQVTLTFYDTAGENLDSDILLRQNNSYIPNARGIIMLLDPLQIPELRKRLSGSMNLPDKNTSPFDILDIVSKNLEERFGTLKKFDIPLAVVFTKMDALDDFEDIIPADSNLRNDSEHVERGAFILDEFENTQAEMEALLSNILGGDDADSDGSYADLCTKLDRFKSHAIFGVSALGVAPDANGCLPETGVKPRRVLDPLLWILKENKFIKVVK